MKKQKILIIEDDLIDQMTFIRMFDRSELDVEYIVVSSIQEAQSEFVKQPFDLVISDYNLADGTPLDLLEHLPSIPFILISGNEDETIINNLIISFTNNRQIEKIASLTKDINLDYLNELLKLVSEFLFENISTKDATNELSLKTNASKKVFVNLDNTYKIFDNNKEDVKETLEIFIEYKPIELKSLYGYVDDNDCENILKVTHKMKSGFRILGMETQYNLVEELEEIAEGDHANCNAKKIEIVLNQLSSDLEEAIKFLKKEISSL